MTAMDVIELHKLFYGTPPRRSEAQHIEHVETTVPQVEKPVGINACFKRLRLWRWEREKRHRIAIQPDGTVTFWHCPYVPTEKVIDGDRVFEATDRANWEREEGFGLVALPEEDWQRLLRKAQRVAGRDA